MNKNIIINSAIVQNNQLILHVNESIAGLVPEEHMLVDSDRFAFIYLVENQEKDYTYIVIPQDVWPILKEAMVKGMHAFLTFEDEQIELTRFQSELEYLIDNIKGNGNYGDEMVGKVEKLF